MEIPFKVVIDSIKDDCIIYFKDTNHPPESPPHYYVCILVEDSSILLSIITSKVEKKEKWYSKRRALSGLVHVDNGVFSSLTRQSVIDCNTVERVRRRDLEYRVNSSHKFRVATRKISAGLKAKICQAIKNSPMVSNDIKIMLR